MLPTCADLTLTYNHCKLHAKGYPFAFSSLPAASFLCSLRA
jgi:hypothetical protein